MAARPFHFLIVDDNADNRFIVTRAMAKTFPDAVLRECWGSDDALEQGANPNVDAIIVHRTTEMTGVFFVQSLRKVNAAVPILMVSSIDRTHGAKAAGANRFLLFENWRQIGDTVLEMMTQHQLSKPTVAAKEAPVA